MLSLKNLRLVHLFNVKCPSRLNLHGHSKICNIVEYLNNCFLLEYVKILILIFYFNILKVLIYSYDVDFSSQSSVSYDPSEIIQLCRFGAQETFLLIIINVKNNAWYAEMLNILVEIVNFFFLFFR